MFGLVFTSKKRLNQLLITNEQYKTMCEELNSEIEVLKEELFKYKPSKGENGRFIKKKKS
jgi:hypothetical protein